MAIFGMPGGAEWWIILAVVLLLFGPTQIPKLMKTIGKSTRALKEGMDGKYDEEDKTAAADGTTPPAPDTVAAKQDSGSGNQA